MNVRRRLTRSRMPRKRERRSVLRQLIVFPSARDIEQARRLAYAIDPALLSMMDAVPSKMRDNA